MRTIRLILRDIRLGIVRRWYIVAFPFILGLIRGYACHASFQFMVEQKKVNSKGTLLDYVMFAMYGMPVYIFDPKDFLRYLCIGLCFRWVLHIL